MKFITEGVNVLFRSVKWPYLLGIHTPPMGDVHKSSTRGVWNSDGAARCISSSLLTWVGHYVSDSFLSWCMYKYRFLFIYSRCWCIGADVSFVIIAPFLSSWQCVAVAGNSVYICVGAHWCGGFTATSVLLSPDCKIWIFKISDCKLVMMLCRCHQKQHTHPDSSWPATWVSYNAVPVWLLQVGVPIRVL